MRIAIILPTYNERENISRLLTTLHDVIQKIKKHTCLILVVDDTSPDGTSELVKQMQEQYKEVHLIMGSKQGLGKALMRGMTYAVDQLSVDTIIQMDADGSHEPSKILDMVEELEHGSDFVVGSRYIEGGSIPDNWGIDRKIFSIIGNLIVRYGLGHPSVHDWTGGFRAFDKQYFELVRHQMGHYSGYVFQIAFLHKAILHNAKISEVPIHFTDRVYGISKIASGEYISNVINYVLKSAIKTIFRGQFGKFAVVGIIGFIINTLGLEVFVHLGFHPSLASSLGAELAIISNFILNNMWTFRDKRVTGFAYLGKFVQFNIASFGAVLIQASTIYIGIHFIWSDSYRIFYVLGVCIGLIWNYTMYSRVIWKSRK